MKSGSTCNTYRIAEDLFILIPMLRDHLVKPFENMMKDNLSPMQFYSLLALQRKGSMTMTELAQYFGIPKQQMTKIINKLADLEMVSRQYDKKDRRIVKIEIDTAGFAYIDKRHEEICAVIDEHMGMLQEEDKLVLTDAIEAIRMILPKIDIKHQE